MRMNEFWALVFTSLLTVASAPVLADSAAESAARLTSGVQARLALADDAIEKMRTGRHDLNEREEDALGSVIVGATLGAAPILKLPAIQVRVNQLGRRLAGVSERPSLNWRFAVIDAPEINAFSAPGGYVLITAGMYQMLDTEEELMAVLAHEIAHVVERHHVANMKSSLQTAKWVGGFAGVLRVMETMAHEHATTRDPRNRESLKQPSGDVQGTHLLSNLMKNVGESYARGLDRDAELEADRMAIIYLVRAGVDPYTYIDVLHKIHVLNPAMSTAHQFLRTHPSSDDRLAQLETASSGAFAGLPWEEMRRGTPLARLFPEHQDDAESMLQGLWHMTFVTTTKDAGGGRVLFKRGIVAGNDDRYRYSGRYFLRNGDVFAEVNVRHYAGSIDSIVGKVPEFKVTVMGKPSINHFVLQGVVVQQPDVGLVLDLRRVADGM